MKTVARLLLIPGLAVSLIMLSFCLDVQFVDARQDEDEDSCFEDGEFTVEPFDGRDFDALNSGTFRVESTVSSAIPSPPAGVETGIIISKRANVIFSMRMDHSTKCIPSVPVCAGQLLEEHHACR
jgi:hypothetical protein